MSAVEVVGGVPVIYVERPGQTLVNLMFRVGTSDETLPQRGVTHLLEHLVLHPLGMRDHHSNGATGAQITRFYAHGSAADAVAFLRDVCASIRALPGHRLDIEKSVLRTEASQRSQSPLTDVLIWRHGTSSDGPSVYPEWGLHRITLADVEAWRDRYLTRHNAVLVVVGPSFPESLELDLPEGQRRPVTPYVSLLPQARTSFNGSGSGLVFETLVERGTAMSVAAQLLNRQLYEALRQEDGSSYAAGCSYEPRDAGHASVVGYADALEDHVDAAFGRMVDVMATLRAGRLPDGAVSEIVAKRLEAIDDPEFAVGRSAVDAFDLLVGAEHVSTDQYRAKLEALTVEEVRAHLTTILGTITLKLPPGRNGDWAGFDHQSSTSPDRVEGGWETRDLGGPGAWRLADEGISLVEGDAALTVWFSTIGAVLAWPDGRRELIAHDGIRIVLEPTMVERGHEVREHVDRHVDPDRMIPMPARDAADVPQPATPEPKGRFARLRRRKG